MSVLSWEKESCFTFHGLPCQMVGLSLLDKRMGIGAWAIWRKEQFWSFFRLLNYILGLELY